MASEAVRSVLNHVCRAIESLGHPFALIGGLALAVWSHPRTTRDIDLLVKLERTDIDDFVEHFKLQGCRPKKTPPLHVVGDHSFLQFLYTPPGEFYDVQFDLLLAESPMQQSALARSVETTVSGLDRPIRVLECNDLILFKLSAGRMIDRADAAMLLRENRESLDTEYLTTWLTALGLSKEFRESWKEAFPTESAPDFC